MSGQESLVGHAFISYVREDAISVDRLQNLLQTAGVRVWRDTEDLWPGEDWRIKIREAITTNALAFLACFSRSSLGRETSYQNEELNLAIEQMRLRRPGEPWLIPIRFDDCDIPDIGIGGDRSLGSIQRVDLFGEKFHENAARLVEGVQRILRRHSGSTSNDARNSRETDPDSDSGSSDEDADERPFGDVLSFVKPTPRRERELETRDPVRVHVGWALWGKRPGSTEDYSVLDSSDEPFSRVEFGQVVRHFTPGVPSAAVRGQAALPWVTISRVGVSGETYLGLTVQTATDTTDNVGRPIIQSSYFCVPYSSLTRTPISYTDLHDAIAEIELPSHNRTSIQVTLSPLNPEELARGIVGFGESVVATTAASLISGPVTVIRAEASTLQDRLWFIEAVAALLPYGYRAGYTATTWSDSRCRHPIRLAFADQPVQGAQLVIWREPRERLADSSTAQEYLTQLGRLRRRYSGVDGLSEIIDRLAGETEPRGFERAQPVISSLFRMQASDASPEGSYIRPSATRSPSQAFDDGRNYRPEPLGPADGNTEATTALGPEMTVSRSETAAHSEESAHPQAQVRRAPSRATEEEREFPQVTNAESRSFDQSRAGVPDDSTVAKSSPDTSSGSIEPTLDAYGNPIKNENRADRLIALNESLPPEVVEPPLHLGGIDLISLLLASTLFCGLGLSVLGYAITKAVWRASSVNWAQISNDDIAGLVIWGICSIVILILIPIHANRPIWEKVFAIAWNLIICAVGIIIAL